MSSEQKDLYIMLDDDDEEWVHPTPASVAITEIVTTETDLDTADIQDLGAYLDWEELRSVLEDQDDGEYPFTIEGHDVRVTADGDITVE